MLGQMGPIGCRFVLAFARVGPSWPNSVPLQFNGRSYWARVAQYDLACFPHEHLAFK